MENQNNEINHEQHFINTTNDINSSECTKTNKSLVKEKTCFIFSWFKPIVWIYISSCFCILFDCLFAFCGLITVDKSTLLPFFIMCFVWIWVISFYFSLLFAICLIIFACLNKLNEHNKKLVKIYEILMIVNSVVVLIAIAYDFIYFCIGKLANFTLDIIFIFFALILFITNIVQWLSIKKHYGFLYPEELLIEKEELEKKIELKPQDE